MGQTLGQSIAASVMAAIFYWAHLLAFDLVADVQLRNLAATLLLVMAGFLAIAVPFLLLRAITLGITSGFSRIWRSIFG